MTNTTTMTCDDAPNGIELKVDPAGACLYNPDKKWAYYSITHYVDLEEWR